jgi:hypothetical protein
MANATPVDARRAGLFVLCVCMPGCLITPWAFPQAKDDAPGAQSGQVGTKPTDTVAPHPDPACAGTPDCDGLDNDCDGTADEAGEAAPASLGFVDADGDGFGDRVAVACDEPRADVGGDCDDGDARVFPHAEEICADGVINACEGARGECVLEGGTLAARAAWRVEAPDGWSMDRVVGTTRSGGPRIWLEASHPDAAAHLLLAVDATTGSAPVVVDIGLPVTHNFHVLEGPDGRIFMAGQDDRVGHRAMFDTVPGVPVYTKTFTLLHNDPEAVVYSVYLQEHTLCPVGISQELYEGYVVGDCSPEPTFDKGYAFSDWMVMDNGGTYSVPTSGFVGDVNGDGDPDLMMGRALSDSQGIDVWVLASDSSGPLAATPVPKVVTRVSGDFGRALGTAGDVNGDGYGDIWVLDGGSTSLALPGAVVLYTGGHGLRGTALLTPTAELQAEDTPPFSVDLQLAEGNDLDNDGHSDLVLSSAAADAVGLWYGPVEGVQLLDAADVVLSAAGSASLRLGGDLNGDGAAELMLRDADGGLSVLFGLGY